MAFVVLTACLHIHGHSFPVAVFPDQISRLIQAHVALTRLQNFVTVRHTASLQHPKEKNKEEHSRLQQQYKQQQRCTQQR